MYNCNSCCGSRSGYSLYNSSWPCIWQAAQEAACAAYNAERAAREAEQYAEAAACARNQVDCLLSQYNQCSGCSCHCCDDSAARYSGNTILRNGACTRNLSDCDCD